MSQDTYTFEKLGVCKILCEECKNVNYQTPSKIQIQAIPYALRGRDIIGIAETGSGKTAAFVIPILQSLLDHNKPYFALVISPTRELAFQIKEHFELLGRSIALRVVVIVGGVDIVSQAAAFARKPHVIVATPGRLVDHLENTKGFSLQSIRFLVLDEADRLLSMDFEKELEKIIAALPKERQSFLFSATMTRKVQKLQRVSLTNPVKLQVSEKYATVETLIQNYLFIPAKYKDCFLVFLCQEWSGHPTIIFVDTQNSTLRLSLLLKNLGFGATAIHGGMLQTKRLEALSKFKQGKKTVLIATDLASRGLDIPSVDLIVNYDIPLHVKAYIHRVGRTSRAGRTGRAINLVTQYDIEAYQKVEQYIQKKLDAYPCDEDRVFHLLESSSYNCPTDERMESEEEKLET
ncbi:ATP-dependent RNA helicase [Galdieria sulphuraria]|uniref:ATP-dependent RNA helicase n=1 Tax=Galdieria sulphuraria TaxID=130081 RepID=M2XX93_GALSU|nr:ATP-dependent RNA helicase [Galdieria sulphuraria]EME28248.1 ATP-dependent RNA helicase [Galdieria sulphuraria]|eukprot:XP_005704768.1 ATP-dependent RNA helicase [Galdieria sulphuraria]